MCVASLCCYGVNALPTVNSQSCLQNTPLYEDKGDEDVPRLENDNVYLIPAYNFYCYGNVTQWGAYVEEPGGGERYTIDFNVFRPSGSPNCYSLIGTNRLMNARPIGGGPGSPLRGSVVLNVPVVDRISVQPGDVVGVLPMSNDDDNGIEIDDDITTVTVWYAPADMLGSGAPTCAYQVSAGGNLPSSITSAPVITAVVGKW